MADQVKTDPVASQSNAALTTANDGAIEINKTAPVAAPPPAPADPARPAPADKPVAEPPVVINEADIAASQKENDPHESLSEQIEVLTGEVQALEAKIEKLTSGAVEGADTEPVSPEVKKSDETIVSTPPSVQPTNPEPAVLPPTPEMKDNATAPAGLSVPPADSAPILKPDEAAASKSAKSVDDIYTKVLSTPQGKQDSSDHKDLNDDASIEEGMSGIGTVGEVLVVFGMLALMVLFASPFFRTYVEGSWEAIKSIGWPTATLSLALGFVLFLFNKGRVLVKVLAFILLLVAAIMTVTVFDYPVLGPLSSYIEPIVALYK
jgi:hypothetical protein